MKQVTITLFFFITTITCYGQTLFFDSLNNSVWTSDKDYNNSKIKQAKEIGLSKLRVSKSLLKASRTIWTFKTDLTISYYDYALKSDSIIAICKYEIDKGCLVLK